MNPIKKTVTKFVAASGWRRKKEYKPITLKTFFEDLENRGPNHPGQDKIFRTWLAKIRKDMRRSGAWIVDDAGFNAVKFIHEYVSRLQTEFWKMNKEKIFQARKSTRDTEDCFRYMREWAAYYPDEFEGASTYLFMYKQIRKFGLRMKLFYLFLHKNRKRYYGWTFGGSFVSEYNFKETAKEHGYQTVTLRIHFREHYLLIRPFNFEAVFRKVRKKRRSCR